VSPLDLVLIGNLLVDDLVFEDGTTRMAQPGGALLHAALAAAAWGTRAGCVTIAGSDYPRAALDDLRGKARTGTFTYDSKLTVAGYLREWLSDTLPATVRPATLFSYEQNLERHVMPRIGDMKLKQLTGPALNRLYGQLLAPGANLRSPKRGLSPRTVQYIHTVLHRALKDAVRHGLLQSNPADLADPPPSTAVQKAGLNRAILGAGWGRFVEMLTYKVIPEGGTVIRRPAAYSSQECALCHHIDAASRVSRDLFVCTACGHTKHADTNASQVILSCWERETAVEPTVAVCGGTAARERPVKQKLRVVRRGTRHVDPGSPSLAEDPAFM